jgi:hypothetical protein
MISRYKKITDPDGNEVDPRYTMREGAYIEKLDGRNPLYKYYKYRFSLRGVETSAKFVKWMTQNFGPSMSYSMAKHYVKCGLTLDDVPWVHQNDSKSYWHYNQLYFNQGCEVLIRLNFRIGATP